MSPGAEVAPAPLSSTMVPEAGPPTCAGGPRPGTRTAGPLPVASGCGPAVQGERSVLSGVLAGDARGGSGRASAATNTAALQRTTLVLAHAAPHTGVLAALQSPGQALLGDGATTAYRLRLCDLHQGRSARPDREEQLRVLVAADRVVTPIPGLFTPRVRDRGRADRLRTGFPPLVNDFTSGVPSSRVHLPGHRRRNWSEREAGSPTPSSPATGRR
jgi:hypothetical protein